MAVTFCEQPRRWARALLRLPLFYKILVANGLLVVVGAIAGTVATAWFVTHEPDHSPLELVLPFALVGTVLSVAVNAAILRLALRPLARLEEAAARVREGDLDARATISHLADDPFTHLTTTFNGMLDSLATSRTQMRDLAARALGAEEEERKRIARELHDETAQTLTAILIQLRLARGAASPEQRDRILDAIRLQVAAAVEGVRRFARGLRPPALDELGLVAAIESHARALEQAVGIRIRILADPVSGALPPEAELALYRIVQEALSNAVRHAQARTATIQVGQQHGRLQASIQDDGRGFDVGLVLGDCGTGLGLCGMRERAGYIGGSLEIHSAPGQGTRIVARVPLLQASPVT